MVGFNRRFSPFVAKMKALLDGVREPKVFIATINAGEIPPEHWTQDPAVGGGRIVGEGCHFVDLLRHLAGSPIAALDAKAIGGAARVKDDKAVLNLTFEDGSLGTIHYLANGHKSFPKERVEVFAAGRVLQLDNFRRLTGYGWPGFRKMTSLRQDKGNAACAAAFVDAVRRGGPSPVPFAETMEVSRASVRLAELLRP
jgi:predicted dehydrogenase